ncbi:MAG: hypothetical protein K2N72_00425, partial [Oscillospiraceae bacterium]|nr:hypothetical protein [Oscillospiraceae bacterium]
MNNQQVFELWKSLTESDRAANAVMYQKADNYVSGKTNTLEIVPRNGRGFGAGMSFWKYPDELVNQLDGDGTEVAKRALIAYSQLVFGTAAKNSDGISIAARIGYSLTDCLYDMPDYLLRNNETADIMLKFYPEQTAELITPDNIKRISKGEAITVKGSLIKKDKAGTKAIFLAMYMAKLMIIQGSAKEPEKLKDVLFKAAKTLSEWECTAIICGIHEGNREMTELLKALIKNPECASYYCSYYDSISRREAFDKLGMYEDYLYMVLCEKLDNSSIYNKALTGTASDEALAMRMIERAEKDKDGMALCEMAFLTAKALAAGGGQGLLERLEMHFGEMLGELDIFELIVGGKNTAYKANLLFPAVYDDPVKASEMIDYGVRCSPGNKRTVIKAFAVLYGYSPKARAVFTALLLAATSDEQRASLIFCFVKGRKEAFKEECYDSFERLVADGIDIDIIFDGMAGCHESWYYNDRMIESAEFVRAHSNEAVAYFKKISSNAKRAAWFAELLVKKGGFFEPAFAITLFTHKSKVIQKMIGDIMASKEDELRPEFEKALPKMKGDAKARSEALLKRWENARKYGKNFDFPSSEVAETFVEENFTNAHEKAVGFIPEELMTDVRFADLKGTASARYMKYIIGEYMVLDAPANLPVCGKLAAMLHAPDLQDSLENIVQNWIDGCAD